MPIRTSLATQTPSFHCPVTCTLSAAGAAATNNIASPRRDPAILTSIQVVSAHVALSNLYLRTSFTAASSPASSCASFGPCCSYLRTRTSLCRTHHLSFTDFILPHPLHSQVHQLPRKSPAGYVQPNRSKLPNRVHCTFLYASLMKFASGELNR
ncbi:hypothetical protein FVE85_8472 [Porphyridium purpureum]|uniref:Uncharacterized protein n=1 Tax=Porphyridium purpureum TaxID=35688 RepID=A0A5J4YM33_PORPP|nr:hypothetical protein FVE85_8472 [Porphyridium purpureum]|eukprot:POR1800..scf244_11